MTASRARVIAQPRLEPLPKTDSRRPSPRRDRMQQSAVHRPQVRPNPLPQNTTARSRRISQPLPAWLRFLLSVQQLSIISTVLLTVAVFGVYSWTVYAQESWNEQYRKLETLKRFERQITTAEETLDNNLINTVQKRPGSLVREKPEQSLFLEAAPVRPGRTPSADALKAKGKPSDPLGY